ncbi:MAG TPA: hypothetical protein VF446_02950 [Trinickia sp.]
MSIPGAAVTGPDGAVTIGVAAEPDPGAAAPARTPDADEPSPPPQPAITKAAAMEMQCNFALNGMRIFNPLMEIVSFICCTNSFSCYLE